MNTLLRNGTVKPWVGSRAAAYDGFPTLGKAYSVHGNRIDNARVTTHLGSGGVSFAPAVVKLSQSRVEATLSDLEQAVLRFSSSNRSAVDANGNGMSSIHFGD